MGRGDALDRFTTIIGKHTLTTMGGTTNRRDGDMPMFIVVGIMGIGTRSRPDVITETIGTGISIR